MRLAVLITSFNRKNVTLAGLKSLKDALDTVDDLRYRIFLLDDASPDGTANAVRSIFPDVDVIDGTGSLFWGRGVGWAYEAARRTGSYDAYLLFNDDMVLDPDGVRAFFADYREVNTRGPSMLGGATLAKDGSEITYSGFRKTSVLRPLAGVRIVPDGTLRPMDMPNGNFLLSPGPFFESVGGVDPTYFMGYADIDLGLTARRHGVDLFLARKPVGFCDSNPLTESLKTASFKERLKILNRPIFQFFGYSHFVLKFAPRILYPIYFLAFYIRRARLLVYP